MSEEKQGLHYPLYVRTPPEMNITAEQFHKLSYFGIGALLCSWKFVIEEKRSTYNVYASEGKLYFLFKNWRYKEQKMKAYSYESAEMERFDIPKKSPSGQFIKKHFSRFILKK